jgi:23S rRNA (uracil1939-C5)-methyltransferase
MTALHATLTIDSVAFGGKGVARVDGKVWFVQDTVPGDVVRAEVTMDSGRYCDARAIEILTPSPARGTVPCAVATECGGCQWLGVEYSQQLAWKLGFVTSALKRIGKLAVDTPVTILPSPAVTSYRNRILVRMHVNNETVPEGSRVGYFQRGTHVLVDVESCTIAAPELNAAIARLRALSTEGLSATTVRIEIQTVERAADGAVGVVLTVFPAEGGEAAARALVERLTDTAWPELLWAGLVFDLSAAPLVVYDREDGITYLTLPGQFQQVNVAHNRTLRRLVRAYVEKANPKRLLDVFCGSGNLSLQLAGGDRYVEGVEVSKKAIACAWHSAKASGITEVNYLVGDAEKHLWKCDRSGEHFDMIILDPPRQGMYGGMVPLKNLGPRDILYVSCDPTTLARDLSYLCRKNAYKIEAVTALDFFPNTYHVETVVHLRRLA